MGGPVKWLSFISVVSLFATAVDEYTGRHKQRAVLTLSQKYAHLVVFASNLLYRTTLAVPDEHIRASTHGQLDKSKILSSSGLVE